MPKPNQTPKAFERYAPAIGAALQAFPNPIKWTPKGSHETFAARFRDAVKAGLKYEYKDPHIDHTLFQQHGGQLSVAIRDDNVIIGPRNALRTYNTIHNGKATPVDGDVEVDFSDPVVATTLCELIKRRVFRTPVAFTVGPISDELVAKLENDYGVTLVPVKGKPRVYTLL